LCVHFALMLKCHSQQQLLFPSAFCSQVTPWQGWRSKEQELICHNPAEDLRAPGYLREHRISVLEDTCFSSSYVAITEHQGLSNL
jgi:hypothetical protein